MAPNGQNLNFQTARQFSFDLTETVASLEGKPSGLPQRDRGAHGQYVYLILLIHPKGATIQRLGLQIPGGFTRATFSQIVVAHGSCTSIVG